MAGEASVGEECAADGVGVRAFWKEARDAASEGMATVMALSTSDGTSVSLGGPNRLSSSARYSDGTRERTLCTGSACVGGRDRVCYLGSTGGQVDFRAGAVILGPAPSTVLVVS